MLLSRYLVFRKRKRISFQRGASWLKYDRYFFLLTSYLKDESEIATNQFPKSETRSARIERRRSTNTKRSKERFVLNLYASFSTRSSPSSLFNREANYKPKDISLLDRMFMLANNARGQWPVVCGQFCCLTSFLLAFKQTAINFSIKK